METSNGGSIVFDDLPDEVLIEGILFHLDCKDVDRLGQTSRRLSILTKDEAFWRKRIRMDFGLDFDLFDVDRVTFGFARNLWKGLRNPKVYVWGSTENHRSGIPQSSPHLATFRSPPSVPYPVEITSVFKSSRGRRKKDRDRGTELYAGLVELKSGGFSFIARDSEGDVWVWGQLDASFFGGQWDYASASKRVVTPTKLGLPAPIRKISIGRRHILLLDEGNEVWEMRAYGRAYKHTGLQLAAANAPLGLIQAEAGWNWSVCLSNTGKIYAWWPFLASYANTLTADDRLQGPLEGDDEDNFQAYSEQTSIPVKWGEIGPEVPRELPAIPTLTAEDVHGLGKSMWGDNLSMSKHTIIEDPNQVIAVGAGDNFCAALKANGELWFLEVGENDNFHKKTWRYLAALSGPDVRHVSASFNAITSYSTTKTFSVKFAELSTADPHISTIDTPSGIPVRKVVMGDYHTVACDHAGHAFAWGENTAGQLGRGEIGSRNVGALHQPTVIPFGRGDERNNKGRPNQRYLGEFSDRQQRTETGDFKHAFWNRRFVFDVAAGGWQSGALVVDMRDYCATGDGRPSSEAMPMNASADTTISAENADKRLPKRADGKVVQSAGTPGDDASSMFASETGTLDASLIASGISQDGHEEVYDGQDQINRLHLSEGGAPRRGGLPFVRFGFAARGAFRGSGGFNVPRR